MERLVHLSNNDHEGDKIRGEIIALDKLRDKVTIAERERVAHGQYERMVNANDRIVS